MPLVKEGNPLSFAEQLALETAGRHNPSRGELFEELVNGHGLPPEKASQVIQSLVDSGYFQELPPGTVLEVYGHYFPQELPNGGLKRVR